MASLPPVPPTLDPLRSAATINALVREYNRTDRKAPIVGTDTGTGAAYAIAPVPGIVQYEVGQEFTFQAVHANTTTTPTLNVNGLTAGTITDAYGGPLAIGSIGAGTTVKVMVAAVVSGVPTFVMEGARQYLTNALAADVVLNNTATWFTGPQVAQGTSGIWLAMGKVVLQDTTMAANLAARLTDGTTTVDSGVVFSSAASGSVTIPLAGVFSSPSGNIRVQGLDGSSTNGKMLFNAAGDGRSCTLTAVRIG